MKVNQFSSHFPNYLNIPSFFLLFQPRNLKQLVISPSLIKQHFMHLGNINPQSLTHHKRFTFEIRQSLFNLNDLSSQVNMGWAKLVNTPSIDTISFT